MTGKIVAYLPTLDGRMIPIRDRGTEITPVMIEAGARALELSGWGSDYEDVTAEQAVAEIAKAMGFVTD